MSKRLLDKLPKLMEYPEFVAAWEEARDEFLVARLESGEHLPSVSTLKRVAEATLTKLRIELVPAGGEPPAQSA